MIPNVELLWSNIANFETGERKHESNNPVLAEARAAARMEAYGGLFYLQLGLR